MNGTESYAIGLISGVGIGMLVMLILIGAIRKEQDDTEKSTGQTPVGPNEVQFGDRPPQTPEA